MISSPAPKHVSVIFMPWFKMLILAVTGICMISFLLWIPGLLSSFLIAVILVNIFSPAVDFFERRGWSRSLAILNLLVIIMVVAVVLVMLLSNLLVSEYDSFADKLEESRGMLNDVFKPWVEGLEKKLGFGQDEAWSLSTRDRSC